MNLGLRWAYTSPFVEKDDRQANFDLSNAQIQLAGQDGNSRALYEPFYNGWEPRLGNFAGTLFLAQVMGRAGVEYDVRKFEYLGAPARDFSTCTLSKRTGIANLQQWLAAKNPVKIGGIGPGDFTYEIPKILEFALGLPIQVVAGYKGTAPIRLAVESGEVDGVCMDWNSIKATWRKALDSGDVKVVVQIAARVRTGAGRFADRCGFCKEC